MQNIHIKRFADLGGCHGTIEPEDRSWLLHVSADNTPSLWRQVKVQTRDGRVDYAYADVELPGSVCDTEALMAGAAAPLPETPGGREVSDALDFTIVRG